MMVFAYWELSCVEETHLHVLAAGEVQMESRVHPPPFGSVYWTSRYSPTAKVGQFICPLSLFSLPGYTA